MSSIKWAAQNQIDKDRARLRDALNLPGMTCRNVAAFTGTSKAAVSRMQNHKPLSAENYLSIHLWLNTLPSNQTQGNR